VARIALNYLLLSIWKYIDCLVILWISKFIQLLQAQLAINISERKELLIFIIILAAAILKLNSNWIARDKAKLDLESQKTKNDIEKEELREKRIKNDILEQSKLSDN